MRLAALSSVLMLVLMPSCSTLATPGSGDQNLPSSGAGPFQALAQTQVEPADIAPFVFFAPGKPASEPTVIAGRPDDPSSPSVIVYLVVPGAQGSVVVRTRADDGVSFYGDTADAQQDPSHRPPVVLAASLAWEGTDVTGPSALRVGPEIWLYYAAQGGIGLARSSDGRSFDKTGQPVRARDPGARWEKTAPRAPSVAVFPDGSWHMLYAAGASVGEATSVDGLSWRRVDGDPATPALDPVLEPSAPVDPRGLPPGERPPFDEATVEDPLLVPRVDPTGQLQVRVLYAGYSAAPGDAARAGEIGFAARYGGSGRLTRQAAPVYVAPGASAAGPALLSRAGGSVLYVSQLDTGTMPPALALAAAYDPGVGGPPAVGKFAASP